MLNNAWPSLIWHLYDYYLRPGGGYFGTQKACEPVHVMYAPDDYSVVVTNQTRAAQAGLVVKVRVLDAARPAHELVTHAVAGVDVPADGKAIALTLPAPAASVTFVDLRLETAAGEPVSDNLYWLPREPDVLDYPAASWLHCPTARHADCPGYGHYRRRPSRSPPGPRMPAARRSSRWPTPARPSRSSCSSA